MRNIRLVCCCSLMFALAILAVPPAPAQFAAAITIAPPALPVYEQPICPGPGYLWAPGYWAWGPDGYYVNFRSGAIRTSINLSEVSIWGLSGSPQQTNRRRDPCAGHPFDSASAGTWRG
jgi:hypothetical protein